METIKTNTVVIGGGPGGYVTAIRLGQLGIDTVIVEEQRMGGTCLNVGCIPSKALLHAAFEYYKVHSGEYDRLGIMASASKIDWKKTIAWKDNMVTKITGGVDMLLKANKVKTVKGRGVLADAHTVKTDTHTIHAENIVLATGSKILELPAFPFDGDKILNSTHLLSLTEVPFSMILLGGGIIGMELGNVYAALGCKVTIIEMAPRILINYEKEAADIVASYFKKIGGEIFTGAKALNCKSDKKGVSLDYELDGKVHTIKADKLGVAVGRLPNISGLGLESLNINAVKGRIPVDKQLRTSVPHIYAIGDLIDGPMLAHKASAEGEMCAEAIAGHKVSRDDIKIIPDIVYTKPEIAKAGFSEEEAQAKGIETVAGKFPFTALGRAATTDESVGYVKYLADKATNRVVGVTIVSNKASELISEAVLAIEMGATAEDIMHTVHPHPTFSEAHMEAAGAVLKKAIHIVNR